MNAVVNVIRAEIYKVLRKRRTYVLAGLQWVLLPVLTLIVGNIVHINIGGSFVDESGIVGSGIQQLASPFGIARVGLIGPALLSPSFYLIVIALFAALLVGEERSQKMWKTTLVAQPARLSVLTGKVVVAMLVFGALMLGAFVFGALFGALGTLFLPTTFAGAWGELLGLYALQWLFGLAAVLFSFLMIFMVRNMVLGIVMVFFVPALLEGLYTIYRATVGFQPLNRLNAVFQGLRLRQTLEDLPRYFFTNNLYAPSRSPLPDLVTVFGGSPGSDEDLGPLANIFGAGITLEGAAVVMLVYSVIFGGLLVWLFLRRDVQ
jgi:ABC-type transport system involved in multi-copper enzyme maturation permease subunit